MKSLSSKWTKKIYLRALVYRETTANKLRTNILYIYVIQFSITPYPRIFPELNIYMSLDYSISSKYNKLAGY